jgi:hypothetical protein
MIRRGDLDGRPPWGLALFYLGSAMHVVAGDHQGRPYQWACPWVDAYQTTLAVTLRSLL